MRLHNSSEVENFLAKWHWFDECVIDALEFLNYATIVRVRFNYIYNTEGKIRDNLDQSFYVILLFQLVQSFRLSNSLNETMKEAPHLLNWGFNEVTTVEVIKESKEVDEYTSSRFPYTHVALPWNDGRRIEIIFSGLEVHVGE